MPTRALKEIDLRVSGSMAVEPLVFDIFGPYGVNVERLCAQVNERMVEAGLIECLVSTVVYQDGSYTFSIQGCSELSALQPRELY